MCLVSFSLAVLNSSAQLVSLDGKSPCLPGSTGNPHSHVIWPHLPFSSGYLCSHSLIDNSSPHVSLLGHLPGYILIFCLEPCCLPCFFGSHLQATPLGSLHCSTGIGMCWCSSTLVTVVKSYGRTTVAPEWVLKTHC